MKKIFYFAIIASLFIIGCKTGNKATRSSSQNIEAKYAKILGVNEKSIANKKLYSFIEDWYGTKYEYGGTTKKGIDCSGFASILYKEIFEKEITGSSASIYKQCKQISKNELAEGDLVFFKIDSKDISHIGVYLQNNKFVHATTKQGVMIDDLNEEYYKKYFETVGRLK